MKCPECGKELGPEEILVPLFDETGKEIIGFFHGKKAIHDAFLKACQEMGENPGDVLQRGMKEYLSKKRHIRKS